MSPSQATSPAADTIAWADPQRQAAFSTWLEAVTAPFALDPASLRLASADASFRRYLRIESAHGSRIIMDAPPDKGSCDSFVQVAGLMQSAGLKVPQILQWDAAHGFMLLSDLGQQTMLQAMDLNGPPPLALYQDAVKSLVQWQLASRPGVLPPYDAAFLRREVELYPQWYITEYRQQTVDEGMRKTLNEAFDCIIANNLSWPTVYVHRDFMPRNLMVGAGGIAAVPQEHLGVLDFQDALYGPITYDIASLMRDAFVSWDEDFCLDVTIRYWDLARKSGLPVGDDFGEFYRGVEWMGLQRHLKIAGIFARLSIRDGKPQYLADTPRFSHYIRSTCSRYIELKPLLRLVEQVDGIESLNVFGFATGRRN